MFFSNYIHTPQESLVCNKFLSFLQGNCRLLACAILLHVSSWLVEFPPSGVGRKQFQLIPLSATTTFPNDDQLNESIIREYSISQDSSLLPPSRRFLKLERLISDSLLRNFFLLFLFFSLIKIYHIPPIKKRGRVGRRAVTTTKASFLR